MSDPKCISPLLDGYAMGAPMSSHDGVRCCPAMKESSQNKYIVKIISIPASQVQLNALLLTGAYKDPAAATDYFKSQADGITKEAELLSKLSKLEGFLPYDAWQIVPMENNELGYDVYLVSSYKRSLEKFMRRNPMTHLGAVNLGLDLCAALAIARNAGYLYLDLKPSNIFISDDKEYRIGDLGFTPLSSLKYCTLLQRCRSAYTAPELHDDMATLNTTADIYSVGLILYQVYNNGVLPFTEKAPNEPLPTPLNADYEIAEIIMKACAPDPNDRWKDPLEMGQALVSYMQRNVVNDLPINPPMAEVLEPVSPAASAESDAAADASEEAVTENAAPTELRFLADMTSDETAPTDRDADELSDHEMTHEVSSMLAQADELLAHEVPDPTVPIAEELPEQTESEEAPDHSAPEEEPSQASEESPADDASDDGRKTMVIPSDSDTPKHPQVVFDEDDAPSSAEPETTEEIKPKKKHTALIVMLVLLALLAALATGAYYFYRNYYILEIQSLELNPTEKTMTVTINTDVDTSLLTVVCSDSYGNVKRSGISDGQAVFTDLTPDTMYQVQLVADGFHKLVGPDNSTFTTAAETTVRDFSAATGTDDGSVVLSFTVEGPENEWNLIYDTEGEDSRSITFTGHSVTVTGLTVGSTYTFRLEPVSQIYLVGEPSLSFTASRILLAQDLRITSCSGGKLHAEWASPADASVESWSVLCYGDDGYQQLLTTADTSATFEGLGNGAYTVEVTADGMTQLVRTSITANPITVKEVSADSSDPESITVTWEYEGNAPADGWLLMYHIDGSDIEEVVRTETNQAIISPKIPDATYTVSVRTASANTVFNDTHSFTASSTTYLFNQSLNFEYVITNLLVTPDKASWTYQDVSKNDYTNSFRSGESISILLRSGSELRYWVNHQDMNLMYVIRDANGKVLPQFTEQETVDWYDFWWNTSNKNYHYAELDLPQTPTEPGNYTLDLYFDGYAIGTASFTITQ